MSEESSVQVVEEKKKAGHPGKKGTLKDLFALALTGVESKDFVRIANNFKELFDGVENGMKNQRNFKVQDMQVVLQLRDYVLSELDS